MALYYNDLGNAYRLAGDPKSAGELYQKALSIDPGFAFPYNGLGDMYRDLALAAIDRGQGREAIDDLLKAQSSYRRSLDPGLWGKEGGPNRAIPFTNLGQILLQLGELTAQDKDSPAFAKAQSYIADANRSFQMALGEVPDYPYAQVGIGQTYATDARLQAVQGKKDLWKQDLARAREHLEGISRRYPEFAVARTALGEVYYAQGDSTKAEGQFLTATKLDPGYAQAYFQLANVLQKSGRADEARLYYQTYLIVESPLFRSGTRVKQAESSVATPLAFGSVVPSVVGMNIKDAFSLIEKSGFRRGSVERRVSAERPDTVIEQSPRGSEMVRKGTSIDLVVAGPSRRQGTVVPIPSVVGMNVNDALSLIEASGFRRGSIERRASDQPPDTVIEQSPRGSAKARSATSINLVVAVPSGRQGTVVPVPSVVGMNIKDALSLIEKSGFRRGSVERRTSDQRPDTVMEQSPRGSEEARRGTPVNLVVAVRPGGQVEGKPVKVPKLIGDTVDEATKKIQRSGLTSQVVEKMSCDSERKVVNQDPKKDALVQPGSAVSITVTGPGPGAVSVPDLRGVNQREALRRLHELGLAEGKISPQETNQEREGTVLSQDPKSNTPLARGCPVNLRVAAAVPQIQVPNFIGMTEAQARKQLPG